MWILLSKISVCQGNRFVTVNEGSGLDFFRGLVIIPLASLFEAISQ
jgi:hypothetical protein